MKAFILLWVIMIGRVAAAQTPSANGSYQFSPDFPKYVTAHVEVRDPSGVRWPSFFYGKPAAAGTIDISGDKPAAKFTLKCDNRPQRQGDQSRRVLGEVFDSPEKGGITLQVTTIAPPTRVEAAKQDEWQTTFDGSLEVAGRKLMMSAPGRCRLHQGGRGDEKHDSLICELIFDTKAAELGLRTFPPDAPIRIRAAFTAYAPGAGARRTPPIR